MNKNEVISQELTHGCRCRIRGTTFFGQFLGYTDLSKRYLKFYDEEIMKVKVYKSTRVVKSYEKWI